ncbi:hypothetical protein V5O48_010920 [Marasmius crinis-equi]|uniref:F-box domain-containing protein n=1 Tax=Marasmius crinis-equi TaxID=585013 RepID=A0ABR3F717_9AGAR
MSTTTTLTRFTQVLDTNYAPSKREREEIRAMIQDPEQEIRRIDEEISRLQARHDELSRFVTSHRMLLSPFRRLPGELWGEIFVRCLPNGSLPVRSLAEAPLLLTGICRTWREVALNTPTLWNAVHISIPPMLSYRGIKKPEDMRFSLLKALQAREQGFKQWLDRSGSLPLTLSLHDLHSDEGRDPENQSEREKLKEKGCLDFMTMVVGFSRRWRSLSLFCLPPSFLRPLEVLTSGDLPLLEEIRDMGTLVHPRSHPFQTPPTAPEIRFPEHSPVLRTLHTNLRTWSDIDLIPVRLARLTVLNLTFRKHADGPSTFQRLAQSCPLLTECTLNLAGWGSSILGVSSPPLSPRAEWAFLRKLDFGVYVPNPPPNYGVPATDIASHVRNILESITTPALTHLRIRQYYPAAISPDQESCDLITNFNADVALYNLIARSRCVLVSLELLIPLGPQFPMVLSLLPSLHTISFDLLASSSGPHVTSHQQRQLDAVLDSLMPTDDGTPCPELKTMQLWSCHPQIAPTVVDFLSLEQCLVL